MIQIVITTPIKAADDVYPAVFRALISDSIIGMTISPTSTAPMVTDTRVMIVDLTSMFKLYPIQTIYYICTNFRHNFTQLD